MTNCVPIGRAGQRVRLHVVMALRHELEHVQLIVIARSMRLIHATMGLVVRTNVPSGHHGRLVRQHVVPQLNRDYEHVLIAIQIVKLVRRLIADFQHAKRIAINYVPVGPIGQTVPVRVDQEPYQGLEHVQLIVTVT